MSSSQGENVMFERLKTLLLGDVAERLDSVETKAQAVGDMAERLDAVEAKAKSVDDFIGASSRLEDATAQILAGALRRAEVTSHGELARALAPLVVAAIRNEIKNSKEMMVEALYPITGRLVTAAVANAFRNLVEELNQRVDALVSADVWRLRLRALMSGRSIAEVALADADRARLRRALLLERGSGRALASWPEPAVGGEQAELTSGLIAAVTEFAAQAYATSGGELRMLDLGSSKVFLRASARIIVAAEFAGELPPASERRLDEAFLKIVEAHEKNEHAYDAAALADILNAALTEKPKKSKNKTPAVIVGGALAALALWAVSGPATRALRERRVNKAFDATLAAHKDLSNCPLRLDFDHEGQRVVLRGLCASESDLRSIADAIAPDAFPYAVERDVKLVSTQDDTKREAAHIAQLDATLGEARAALAVLRAEQDSAPAKLHRLEESFAVFFTTQDNLADPASTGAGLDELARLLKLSGEGVRVIGYADEVGTPELNRAISRQRIEKVVAMLVERGAPRERLVAAARATLDPIASNASGATRNRRVVFERLYDGELPAR